jgi:hypothetical protein
MVNRRGSSSIDGFIFVPSRTIEEERQKQGREGRPVAYEPEEEELDWASHGFEE